MRIYWIVPALLLALVPASLRAQEPDKGKLVEQIIARVNNDIITSSDYERSEGSLREEISQDCTTCTNAQLGEQFQAKKNDLLRDLIDQSLLVQRAKDLSITVETDLVKRLDQVRQQNKLTSMEALEKEVEKQGISWEDYKDHIRDTLLTQEVVRREVGSRVVIDHAEVQKYYDAHKTEFNRPEQVALGEILLNTDGKDAAQIDEVKKKADDLLTKLKAGADFEELARRYSEGQTAKQGGQLGEYKHGELAPEIEDQVFKLERNQNTGVIQTKTGFEILRVYQHYQAGEQPLDKVEPEIMNALYQAKIEPTMRGYLAELREESYLVVAPGYTDTAAVAGGNAIKEVSPTADTSKGKKPKKSKKSQSTNS
jgi:peptidyl-prolyl cis-trans isomerase SurA